MASKSVSMNAPCPCGSGKKFKHCCIQKKVTDEITNLTWQKIILIGNKLSLELLRFTKERLGRSVINASWEMFGQYRDGMHFDSKSLQNQLFFPWLYFNWKPSDWDFFEDNDVEPFPSTIAEAYLKENRTRLSYDERRYIDVNCQNPFSFYEVLECIPGKGYRLKDLLLKTEAFVEEHMGSENVSKGSILYGKIALYDKITMMSGMAPIEILPKYKIDIINLKEDIYKDSDGNPTIEDLFSWEDEIRDLYWYIFNAINKFPELRNNDGNVIIFHDLYYKIKSPQIAFDSLKYLAIDIPESELLADAKYNKNNHLLKIQFPWLLAESSKNDFGKTVLGHIIINGNELQVSTNSEERAIIIRDEISQRMGDDAKLESIQTKSLEEANKETPNNKQDKNEDLNKLPEVREEFNRILKKHWEAWSDEEIPALDGLTPKEAIKDPFGREKVTALLDSIEQMEQRRGNGISQLQFIQNTRKKLGL